MSSSGGGTGRCCSRRSASGTTTCGGSKNSISLLIWCTTSSPPLISSSALAPDSIPNSEILPRTVGGELGLRTRLGKRQNLGSAAWWIDVQDEFVYAGDAGKTEEQGRTRRLGIDLEARMQLLSWIWGDLDLNLARGRLPDTPAGQNHIPLAPTLTSTGGLTVRHPYGWEGSLRYRHMDGRPASEDGLIMAHGYTVCDLNIAFHRHRYRIDLTVENLFNTEWDEARFATQSLFRGDRTFAEAPPLGPEIHFTPGNPRNLRVGVSYFY